MNILKTVAGSRALLLTIALVMGIVGAWPAFKTGLTPPDVRTERPGEFDVDMLKKGLDRTPHFTDTFRWFAGDWIGCNPFWRPGSSYVFWGLYRLLGWEHHDRYEVVRGICHVIVTGMLFWFMMVVTGRPLLALVAVAVQNVHLPIPLAERFYTPVGVNSVERWISMPDQWLAMVTLPALWLAWRGAIWWAVPLTAAAAMLKETGFVVFPLVMLFYWWRHRRLHPAFLALIGIAAVFATLKLAFVGPGWILGSNRAMWYRMARFAIPRPINYIMIGSAPWSVAGIALGAGVILGIGPRRRPRIALGVLVAGFAASLVIYHFMIGAPGGTPGFEFALAGVIERRLRINTPVIAVWIIAAWAGLKGPDRWLVVLMAIAHLVLGLPAKIAPQTGTRSLYTARLFSAAITALCIWSLPLLMGRPVPQTPAADEVPPDAASSDETQ